MIAANNPTPSKPPPLAATGGVRRRRHRPVGRNRLGRGQPALPRSAPNTAKVRAALKLRLPKTPIDAINCEGLGGLCEVASKSTLFYVDRAPNIW
jgi:thiol:disulfide interchange protein DsbC